MVSDAAGGEEWLRGGSIVAAGPALAGEKWDMPMAYSATNFHSATGAEFALLPPQNATGNWVKVVQRVPVRVHLTACGSMARTFSPPSTRRTMAFEPREKAGESYDHLDARVKELGAARNQIQRTFFAPAMRD